LGIVERAKNGVGFTVGLVASDVVDGIHFRGFLSDHFRWLLTMAEWQLILCKLLTHMHTYL